MLSLKANPGRKLNMELDGRQYSRYPIHTHFIGVGESYLNLLSKYVYSDYRQGDILCISEKIISLCQRNIVYKRDVRVGLAARLLSKFASKSDAGIGVRNVYKMQVAIDRCGLPKILYASFRAALDKLRGKGGTFYEIAGEEISGLDGFYSEYFPQYQEFGILLPKNPDGVCNEIYTKLGIECVIADVNDFSSSILGCSAGLRERREELQKLIGDNPASNGKEQTPFVLIRETQPEYAFPARIPEERAGMFGVGRLKNAMMYAAQNEVGRRS